SDLADKEGEKFDAVVALEVLEHLTDPLPVLRQLLSIVQPGGWIVVSLPNEAHLLARLQMLFGSLPFGGHDDPHILHLDRQRARKLFEAAGCRLVRERPVSAIPPRWRILRKIFEPAHVLFPAACSIASLYLLSGENDG